MRIGYSWQATCRHHNQLVYYNIIYQCILINTRLKYIIIDGVPLLEFIFHEVLFFYTSTSLYFICMPFNKLKKKHNITN